MKDKHTLLIIDDTLTNIELIKAIIDDEYNTLSAVNGMDGLELAERMQPDLIILDVMMPEMDGYEVCQRLKRNPKTEAIPVIFVTVLDHDEDAEIGLVAGAIDYIAKPYHPASVKAKIRNHLAYRALIEKNRIG
ncbi:response regulator [Paenibacillus sp. GCM10027626]|uniref:response regulator n=1 Tax=Paenibacillus sp. GCM10027626 TaxID=3273411 RepID=UPI00363A9018